VRYAVKFDFDTDASIRSGTKVLIYSDMMKAAGMFNTLSLAYALAKPVKVKGGSINILGSWLYEVEVNDDASAEARVKAGDALLVDFAPEMAVNIDEL
jgi:hypothetical protein